MENASKALIIVAGMLIALLVIGALLFMFNQIGEYGKTQDNNVKYSQLADFNTDFERYCDDKGIKGTDIISLINKIIDYNTKAKNGGVNNSVDYNIKMSITVSNLTGANGFETKYPVSDGADSLFKDVRNGILTINESNQNKSFKQMITTYSSYENTYTLSVMSKLSSSYDAIKNEMQEQGISSGSSKYKELIKRYTGIDAANVPTLKEINQYRQYSEFKRATFSVAKEPEYKNGQIKALFFEFDE